MISARFPLRALSPALAVLLFAGCESRPDRHAMMEEARHSVPPMAASEPFFDGAIVAHLTLAGDTGGPGGSGGDSDTGSGRTDASGGRHGGGRGGMGGGSGHGRRQSGDDGADSGGAKSATSMRASAMPVARLRLRVENTTAAAVEVEVRGLDSELGNFAVRPDKLAVMPGQSEEPDPMESLLGVDTYSLPVTLTLRLAGRTESKVVTLQLVKPAPPAPVPGN